MAQPPFTLIEMKEGEFDQTLEALAARRIPAAPVNLVACVLREIRLRREPKILLVERLANWLWRGHVALASVPAAVAMGLVMALIWPVQEAKATVSHALYLNVFSQYSPTLPSTYIALGR